MRGEIYADGVGSLRSECCSVGIGWIGEMVGSMLFCV